jgi:very-short-patch-repair endonuclease
LPATRPADRRPAALAGSIFLGRDALASGLLTPADLRGRAWQQVLRGIYADATITITHRHRCLAVARFALPPGGAIAGRSAAHLYGARPTQPTDPVEVLVPASAKVRMAGVRTHVSQPGAADTQEYDGLPVTTPLRTCWDLAQWCDAVEAVAWIDALASRRVISLPDVEAYARAQAGRRGRRRLLNATALADAGAESPQESRVRVRLVLAGLPRPQTQIIIDHDGRFVARADLGWPEYKVAVEYDGLWHAESSAQIHADRRRLNAVTAADWVVLHVTAKRLRDDFDGFVRELTTVLRARGAK